MNTLLKTMATVMLAATMVPVCADEPTVHIVIEQQENKEAVDSAAAWAYGVARATTICGSLGIGTVMALSGYPVAFLGGIACSCIWASAMDNLKYWYGMNEATREKAQYVNDAIADGAAWTLAIIALGMAAHKHMTVTA